MTMLSAVDKEPVPTVVFLGRLSANKRPEHAIRAFGLLRRQLPEAQLWVIGTGPEEERLRRVAGPGVHFLGRVPEEEKHERLARAHVLVATSVREGWGLVVTEAAASGTVSIGYDVPGLRDSIGASGGILTRPDPASLATGLAGLLASVVANDGPRPEPAGVLPWAEVAASILTVAREPGPPAISVPEQRGRGAEDRVSDGRGAHGRAGLARARARVGAAGIALLLFGGIRDDVLSPVLVGAAFLALLTATVMGVIEGWPARGDRLSSQRAARGSDGWPSRTGVGIVALVAVIAAQSWFEPGRLLAGGDVSPVVGTAWLARLFAPWSWSGSDLGGPAANETKAPMAAVYWLVHALRGSPALAEDIWYTALFAGAAVACYLLLRALRIGAAGSAVGALAYIFSAHVVIVGTNPVYLAAMTLLTGLPAALIATASGRWTLRRGILILCTSAPLLGYASLNPPLLVMIGALVVSMPLLLAWLDGRAAARRALRALALGLPLLGLASCYWLVPTLLQLKIEATATLASPASWIWTEGRATLANGFWLNNSWGWNYSQYYPFASSYDKFPLLILKFLLPVTAFGFLAVPRLHGAPDVAARRVRLGIAASATALCLVLLSTGTRFPGALIFDPLYKLPLGWLLREPGRFLMLAGLACSVLFALTIEAVWEMLSSSAPGGARRGLSALHRSGARLAAVSATVGAAVLAPGFPLITGAIAPSHRPVLPPTHVRVPGYWAAMASYLKTSAPPGNLLALPEDDYYQMPYTWGYYGADTFITDLIARPVVDAVGQGYAPSQQELTNAVGLVQQGLIAQDWPSVQRTLTAIGTPLLLVRGDVNAAFPGRDITPPAALAAALGEDKGMRLVHRAGKLELFALRKSASPTGSVRSYATVNSVAPDLRDLALLPAGTALVSGPMRRSAPALLQVPPVASWRLSGGRLATSVAAQPGRRYHVELLSGTGRAVRRPGASSLTPRRQASRHRKRQPGRLHRPHRAPPARLARPVARVRHRNGQVVEALSYRVGRSVLTDGDFRSGPWGQVGNCAALPGTAMTAQLTARVRQGQGPAGEPALALSAHANSACEMRALSWRSGPLLVSLWVRNLAGAAPRLCLWELPVKACAAMSPLPARSALSRWYHFQTLVTPDPGARRLIIFLYANVYNRGALTSNEYSDIVIRRTPVLHQPVVVSARPRHARPAAALYTISDGFSSDWTGPSHDQRVEVDGLRDGWIGPRSRGVPVRFGLSRWYELSRLASLLAAVGLLALALPRWRRRRRRREGRLT